MVAEVNKLLAGKRLHLNRGLIVEAIIITAPSPTENEQVEGDPEMRQTTKGNQWFLECRQRSVWMQAEAWCRP